MALLRPVSMVSHVDYMDYDEEDVDFIAAKIRLADLRGLAPRRYGKINIHTCICLIYRELASEYGSGHFSHGGHPPLLMEEAFPGASMLRDRQHAA
jgi:acyl-CoA hydrolase